MRRKIVAVVGVMAFLAGGVAWGELTPAQAREVQMMKFAGHITNYGQRMEVVRGVIAIGPEALGEVEKARAQARDVKDRLACELVIRGIQRIQAGKGEAGKGELKEKLPKDIPLELRMLMEMLWSEEAGMRGEAARELGDCADPAAVEVLIGRLDDAEESVRKGAASGLRTLSGEMFAEDKEQWAKWWEEVRHPKEKAEELIARLSDPREEERARAIWKLGYVKDARAVDALVERFVCRKGGTEAGELREEGARTPTVIEGRDGKKYQVLTVTSGGGLMGREGCMDTKPGYVVVVSGERKEAKVAWHSEKLERGQLVTAAADLDGDGVKEVVVADGRWCEGKGRVYVYRQQEK